MALFVIPMCVSSFQISNEIDSLMFFIATLPAILLLSIETVQMRFLGLSTYMTARKLDISQLVIFTVLFYLRMNNVDSQALYYPELKLVNIILAFFKTMFFARIYEDYGILV